MCPRFPKPDSTIWIWIQQSEPVRSALNAPGACLHWLEEQLDFLCQKMLEVVISSELMCAKLTWKLNLVIYQLQQPAASRTGPNGSEAVAESFASTVSLHSLRCSCFTVTNFSSSSPQARFFPLLLLINYFVYLSHQVSYHN